MYEKKESYLHKFAKELLCKWIIEGNIQIQCKDKIFTPNYNYHFTTIEYPITPDFPYLIDEMGEENCLLEEDRDKVCKYRQSNGIKCPCLDCKYLNRKNVLAVADIVTGYKGLITDVFEIEHKNPISFHKIEMYNKKVNNLFVIEARHILGQIKKPPILKAELVICYGSWYTNEDWLQRNKLKLE